MCEQSTKSGTYTYNHTTGIDTSSDISCQYVWSLVWLYCFHSVFFLGLQPATLDVQPQARKLRQTVLREKAALEPESNTPRR